MNVADNIEFGLRVRKVHPAERRRRRDELLELVGLSGLGGRMPRQISGGQQQRVALARALAHQPDVLLLDEPLGALDAKIRTELRRTLRGIQKELGVTAILVTHDQEEAFELADRIGVMSFGRLLEVGTPEKLYCCPETEFVATFFGTANLLVGQAVSDGVQVGLQHFPLNNREPVLALDEARRVQVLFRPEEVVLGPTLGELPAPELGQGTVDSVTFAGSLERLHLRLQPIPGVRPIAPPLAFGENEIMVEATRTQDESNRFPLRPGQHVWVGVRNVHALAHPGLHFLIPTDGSPAAQAALEVAGHMARLAHARVTLLGYGGLTSEALQHHFQEAKEQLGSGLAALEVRTTNQPLAEAIRQEAERHAYDLVVVGASPKERIVLIEAALQSGTHVLSVPRAQSAPTNALITIASGGGEPGKDDVLFAGRLLRHLGASAKLMTVLPGTKSSAEQQQRAERFLAGGARTLELLGVPATTVVGHGLVESEILEELRMDSPEGAHDLLVIGAPLPDDDGNIEVEGLLGRLLKTLTDHPTLIVRSSVPSRGEPALAVQNGRIYSDGRPPAAGRHSNGHRSMVNGRISTEKINETPI
jgi:ABC-type Fe3+/spermidine/putrescine transport system ATPase subunit/nucleotide-binding universal stress UspA family protein